MVPLRQGGHGPTLAVGPIPGGTPIAVMPFEALGHVNETDAKGRFLYLKSLPGR